MSDELLSLQDLLGSEKEPDNIEPLRNSCGPTYEVKREQPKHRTIALCRAAGMGIKDIAGLVDLAEFTVHNILKQPEVEALVVRLIHKKAGSALEILQQATIEAAQYQVDLLRDVQAKRKERLDTSNAILNRCFGKAAQPVIHSDLNKLSDEDLAAMLPETDATGTSTATGG